MYINNIGSIAYALSTAWLDSKTRTPSDSLEALQFKQVRALSLGNCFGRIAMGD
jgi:hypothetical protein